MIGKSGYLARPEGNPASGHRLNFERTLAAFDSSARNAFAIAASASAAGEIVRRLRSERNIGQSQLADSVGSTQAYVSWLERGLGTDAAALATLRRIIDVFGREQAAHKKFARRQAGMIAEAKACIGEMENLGATG